MIKALTDIVAAFGFSASAGLNAYLTMLIVALAARYTNLIRLNSPYDVLTNGWIIGLLLVLTVVEGVADKIPAVDTAYNVVQSLARPAAGAILFAASSHVVSNVHPALALACGILIAGAVHTAKTVARPVITATTAGVGNPIASTAEDVVAATTTVVSLLAPLVALVVMALSVWLMWRLMSSRGAKA
jgi:hypothetical protein